MASYILLTNPCDQDFDRENETHYPLVQPLTIKRMSEKALLLTSPTDPKGDWYPKAHVACYPQYEVGGIVDSLPMWLIKKNSLKVKLYTQVFDSHQAFLDRPDKTMNGVSRGFMQGLVARFGTTNALSGVRMATYNLFYTDMGNTGCWNCLDIRDCQDCYQCESSTGLIRCFEIHNSTNCTDCVRGSDQHNCYLTVDCQGSSGVSKVMMLHNYPKGRVSLEDKAESLSACTAFFNKYCLGIDADADEYEVVALEPTPPVQFSNALEYMHTLHAAKHGATAKQWGWVDTLYSHYSSANDAFFEDCAPWFTPHTPSPLFYIA